MADGKETWNSDDYFASYSQDPFKYTKDYESPEERELKRKGSHKKQNSKDIEQGNP